MPSANDLRKGMAIKYNNDVCVVLDMQHRTPGNLRAFVQATLRSIKTGKSSNVRFTSTEPVEPVNMNTRRVDFSYKDQGGYHFMDPETYDTISFTEEFVGDAAKYLTENLAVTLMEIKEPPDPERKELIPVVAYAVERRIASGQPDVRVQHLPPPG